MLLNGKGPSLRQRRHSPTTHRKPVMRIFSISSSSSLSSSMVPPSVLRASFETMKSVGRPEGSP